MFLREFSSRTLGETEPIADDDIDTDDYRNNEHGSSDEEDEDEPDDEERADLDSGDEECVYMSETRKNQPDVSEVDVSIRPVSFEKFAGPLGDSSPSLSRLPPHQRCASHTLNLIATTDAVKAFLTYKHVGTGGSAKRGNPKSPYRSALATLESFWNKCGQSEKAHAEFLQLFKKAPQRPVETRWNSMFDGILQVCLCLRKDRAAFNDYLRRINLPRLTPDQEAVLEEYIVVSKHNLSYIHTCVLSECL